MKTGPGGRIRYRTTTALTLAAALALPLVLSGCEDHSPVAAPTSTLPAKDSSAATPATDPQPTIPAYETELDLSPEETEAVEGALIAFEGFLASINGAYSGDYEKVKDFPKYSSGQALDSIINEAESIKARQTEFDGKINPTSVEIFEVSGSPEDRSSPNVIVHFCVDTSQWSLTQAGAKATSNPDGFVTMEHTILFDNGTWTVDKQSLWERKC